MTDEIVVVQPEIHRTAPQIKARVNLIQEVMKSVMLKGTHYDIIKGCGDKRMLLKPGAEVLMTTFMASAEPIAEDLSYADEIRYRIKTVLRSVSTDAIIGYGVGECSSNEEKYKWRKATCEKEFNATPEDRCRIKWHANYSVQQVRMNPSDVANTVLKMGKKRSLVDACLTTFAASDIFTQDGDPLPPKDDTPKTKKSDTVKAADKPKVDRPEGAITEGQERMIYARAASVGDKDTVIKEIKEYFKVEHLYEIPKGNMNDLVEFLDKKAEG